MPLAPVAELTSRHALEEAGLTEAEAQGRLAEYGPNRLPAPVRPAYFAIAARQVADPLVVLLLAATAVSALVGEHIEAVVIAAIVVLNGVLGFLQEAGAERAVLALRRALQPMASVFRDGREQEIPVEDVVRGDLLVLREGDRVAADARMVAEERLQLDESALTGESLPVSKSLGELVFAGTGVTRGRGRALVEATGPATEIGRIARMADEAKPPPTPLQRQLGHLSRAMVALGIGVTAALTAGMLARGEPLADAILVGVSVAVAAVPEGLAATVTIALAQGAREMAARGAIVRRLSAVETLGEATVIAADKTGTLTVNQLRIVAVRPEAGWSERDVLEAGALASTAELVDEARVAGDPVDGAFLLAVEHDPRRAEGRERMLELPFDPERKRLTVVYAEDGGLHLVVKGAPEVLLERSRLSPSRRDELLAAAGAWAADGLRVLAVAERRVDGGGIPSEDELDVIGLVGLRDPLRATAAESIRRARDAGLEVAILTGDHALTAASIARSLDLAQPEPLTGAELAGLDDRELGESTRRHSVFARVTPADKLRLVEALQGVGHVVAVTGDGINDSPALRRADVGVAMGSGTEAAREAAEVVLTDDDFSTIVAAIAEGRRLRSNIRNFVAFLLSANLGEVVLFAIAILAGLGAPMTVVQILLVNLVTDGLPAVALARDPASGASVPRDALLPRRLQLVLALLGLSVGLAATAAYVAGRQLDPDAAQTMAFATVAVAELLLVFSIRAGRGAAWRAPANRLLVAGVVGSFAIVMLVIAVPALRDVVGTTPLGPVALALVGTLAAAPTVLAEGAKAVLRRRGSPASPSAVSRNEVQRDR